MTSQETIQPVNSSYEPGRIEMAALAQRAAADKETAAPREKPAAEAKAAAGDSPWNIRMRFEVEPETQRVTVFIIDKTSQKVIRTIPPEKLETMQQGDLLELFA